MTVGRAPPTIQSTLDAWTIKCQLGAERFLAAEIFELLSKIVQRSGTVEVVVVRKFF